MSELVFLKCLASGNIFRVVKGTIKDDQKLFEVLDVQTADSTTEKHVPVVTVNGENVDVVVGSTIHPMTEQHYIEFLYLETKRGGQIKYLAPGEEPKASFKVIDDEVIAVYEYCNIHGLWKATL